MTPYTYTTKVVRENVGFKQLINDVRKATNAPSVVYIKQQRNIVYLLLRKGISQI